MKITPLLIAAALMATTPARSAELLPNGQFDADIAGWNLPAAPDTVISWDSDGMPGGSLRIDSTWGSDPATAIDVTSSCFAVNGQAYYRPGDARAAVGSGGSCNIDVLLFEDTDCLIPSGYTFASTQSEGTWEHIEGAISTGVAFRVSLRMIRYPEITAWSGDSTSPLPIAIASRAAETPAWASAAAPRQPTRSQRLVGCADAAFSPRGEGWLAWPLARRCRATAPPSSAT